MFAELVFKMAPSLIWNRGDPVLIGKIYGLFLGTFVAKEKEKSKNNPKPEHRRIAANTRLRLKLMPQLLKSREAAVQVWNILNSSIWSWFSHNMIVFNGD